ncbi:hypothetical protein [Sphingomonas desiccabilis]|uniref:Uncharacterized protein n=1 Tax=Sphingomonas desiccabilis TaxID=429134 RepID=A0A4Q2IVS4_9SPHN|nr:hypothetical protein [Sphingomonas desiccabilis]MBB3910150.1 hypothetical protein [Sphingomonas desiccabilis]RXZ34829.1 hypothetical protein EO081_03995 [Sphingomonas desiccabilis]
MRDNIVAVGLLTQRDLQALGSGFDRAFPVDGLEGFRDLLAQLDQIEALSAAGQQGPARDGKP